MKFLEDLFILTVLLCLCDVQAVSVQMMIHYCSSLTVTQRVHSFLNVLSGKEVRTIHGGRLLYPTAHWKIQ